MRLSLDPSILEQMSDGVILLDRHAGVVSSNTSAQFWLETAHHLQPLFKRLIDEEMAGHLTFPMAIDKLLGAHIDSKKQTTAWLCKQGPHEFSIFVVPPRTGVTPQPQPQTVNERFLALLGEQIRRQITELSAALSNQANTAVSVEMHNKVRHLDGMLHDIAKLAELSQRDQVFASERINLDDLIAGILVQESMDRSVRYVFTPGPTPLGMLYGDTSWLTYALQVLIQSLWQGAPPQGHVAISTRQVGDFILVSGHAGTGAASRSDQTAPLQPGSSQISPSGAYAGGEASIRMPLCQRIVELHSGSLKIEWLGGPARAGEGVESFVLTLLSGLPEHERSRVSCHDCRLNLQAQAYAQDIAQLLQQAPGTRH